MIGYRKLLVSLTSIASSTALVAAGLIDPGVYATVVVAASTGYLAANVTQKATA